MPSVRRLAVALPAACALFINVSCGPFMGYRNVDREAAIYFTNDSLEQVAVYATGAGPNIRLGTVGAGLTDTLYIPDEFTVRGSMTVVVRFLARREVVSSGSLMVSRETRLNLRLSANARTIVVLADH